MSNYRILSKIGRRSRTCRECGGEYSPIVERGDVVCTMGMEVTHICWICAREIGAKHANSSLQDIIHNEIKLHVDKGDFVEYIRVEDTCVDFVKGERISVLGRFNDMGITRELRELTGGNITTEEI